MTLPRGVAQYGAWAIRFVVSLVFLVAAVEKLRDPAAFVENIANYQILPEWSPYAAVTIPSVELVAAAALLVSPRRWRLAGAASLLGLLVMFTLALTRAWWIGLNVDCGCFGQGSSTAGPWSVARNLTLITSLAFLAWIETGVMTTSGRARTDAGSTG